MRSYFYGGGIRSSGTSSGRNNSSSSSSAGNDELSKAIQALELQLAALQGQIATLQGFSSKVTALIGRVEVLEENAVTVFEINDISRGAKNVYNTNYINETIRNLTVNYSDDIHVEQTGPYPYVPTLNAILKIKNIDNIPTVQKQYLDSTSSSAQTDTYSVGLANTYFDRVPYTLDVNGDQVTTPNPTVYSKEYIDKRMPIIYSEKDDYPSQNNVYSTEYLNPILSKVPNIAHAFLNDTSGSINVYSCYYINSLPMPSKILFDFDDHVSTSQTTDSTQSNIYNTYYVDQWLNPYTEIASGSIIQYNELYLRMFPRSGRTTKIKQGTTTYYQTFGDKLQEVSLRPIDRGVSFLSRKEPEKNGIRLIALYRNTDTPVDSTGAQGKVDNTLNNGVLNIKSLNVSDGSTYLYESGYMGEEFTNALYDIRYLPSISAMDRITNNSTEYNKKVLLGATKGKIEKGNEQDGEVETQASFSIINHHTDTTGVDKCYLSFGLNNPIPNLNKADSEDVLQIYTSMMKCKKAALIEGDLTSNGNVNLGNTDGSSTVNINGATSFNGTMTFTSDTIFVGKVTVNKELVVKGPLSQLSDSRLKTNIKRINSNECEVISKLNPVSFVMNNRKRYGFIAQEVKEVLPDIVCGNESDGYLSINYTDIIPFLVDEIHKQHEVNRELRESNEQLNVELKELRDEVQELREQMEAMMKIFLSS